MSQVTVTLLVDEDEKAVIRMAAARRGVSVNQFGRDALLREAEAEVTSFFGKGGPQAVQTEAINEPAQKPQAA